MSKTTPLTGTLKIAPKTLTQCQLYCWYGGTRIGQTLSNATVQGDYLVWSFGKSFALDVPDSIDIYANGYYDETINFNTDLVVTVVLRPIIPSGYFNVLKDSSDKVLVSNNNPLAIVLPTEYEKVPYLESDGTAYINTGFVPDTTDFKHTLVFSVRSGQTGQKYICGTGVQEGRSGNLRINSGSIDGLYINKSSAKSILSSTQALIVDTKYKVIIDLHNNAVNTATLNGTSIANTSTGTINSSRPMYLFALNASYIPTYVRIYSSIIKQKGIPIYYLIPVKRVSDDVLGMYDLIQKRFLTNAAASGAFITE